MKLLLFVCFIPDAMSHLCRSRQQPFHKQRSLQLGNFVTMPSTCTFTRNMRFYCGPQMQGRFAVDETADRVTIHFNAQKPGDDDENEKTIKINRETFIVYE